QSPAVDADLVAMGGYPRGRCVRLIDGDRVVRLRRAIVLDEYSGRARPRHEIAHQTLVRRKVAEYPASPVEEHEHRQPTRRAGWAYHHNFDGLSFIADGPLGDVRLRKVDLDSRLETFQHLARLPRSHLLNRLPCTGRNGLQKFSDVALDSRARGRVIRDAGLLGVGMPSHGARVRGRALRIFVPASIVMKSFEARRYNLTAMPGLPEVPVTIEFGRSKVARRRREVLVDGRPVELGGRAFDTLMALIDARGTVLTKDELMSRVWPDRVVEENNLPAQILMLRKVFGPDRDLIRTVAGRGYQFTGEVRTVGAVVAGSPPSPVISIPQAVSELIGREAELREVTALATEHRLVSLVGAGGIGKTRLGLEVARHLLPRFPDGVFVAEFGPLSRPELVPATVAGVLGLTHVAGAASPEGVAGAVGTRKLLLVIDNCEHVIDAAAGMAEALLRASPRASLLATRPHPLRVSGEYIYRVPPLEVPAEDNQDLEDIFRHAAVRLFVARAQAAEPRYMAEARVAAATAAICRHLDGMPLAIELAATRIAAVGVDGLAMRLDDRFRLLTGGSRTLPRHQTMRATLDWSYELLSESERVVLRRLGVFVGAFTLDAATVVAASGDILAADVEDAVASLVGKSLVS